MAFLLSSCSINPVLETQYESVDQVLEDSVSIGIPGISVCYGHSLSYQCKQDGFISIETETAVELNSQFRLASITKTFTAALVFELAKKDLIDVNGRYIDYVDTDIVSRIPNIEKVTILNLLEHTSGIFNFTNSDGFERNLFGTHALDASDMLPNQILNYVVQEGVSPTFLPGQDREYSNSGYILLGLLIEKVTGLTYAQALQEFIFGPCGMNDTFVEGESSGLPYPPLYLNSYTYADTWDRFVKKQFGIGNGILTGIDPIGSSNLYNVSHSRQHFNAWAWSAGAVVSSAPDLAKFLQCYFRGDFQTALIPEELLNYKTYGWRGLSTGIDALMMYDVKDEYFYIVLVNATNGVVDTNDIYLKLREVVNR